ncbi:MAG: class I SAM-dependent methyltransferase [Planctomycetota bacterium]
MARGGAKLARPAVDEDFANPLQTIDPLGWLGGSIAGWRVLCLAAGGGRQSALYAAAGARVTVLDISPEMLARDREVAAHRGYSVHAIEGSMDDLSMLPAAAFDAVVHPVSTCYLPDVQAVYRQVARVTRPGGLYVSQHKSPVSLQASLKPAGGGYAIQQPYYRDGPLPPAEQPSRLREPGTLEFLHRWEELVGGLCRAGFAVEDLVEPMHADAAAEPGAFGHRCRYVAPYVRIKARRAEGPSQDTAAGPKVVIA